MMNKSELIDSMAAKSNLTKKDSALALEAFMASVGEELAKGGKVQLMGFGTFETREHKARIGRNPQKPEETIEIPARTSAAFKPGKALKEAVNK